MRISAARTLAGLLATLALVAGTSLAAAPPAAAASDPPPHLSREGRWLVDQYGRIVLVHGQNLVWKHAPYVPPDSPDGFTAKDAEWLAEYGFNGARVGTLWAGISPDAPDQVDASYLDRWQRVADLLSDEGIWTLYDLHQDQWNETYAGEGVPDWAVHRPAPYNAFPAPTIQFPGNYFTPELSQVFDDFYADKDGLRDDWAAAARAVAARFAKQPYSMGYDLLNEPWPGQEWSACALTGCPSTYHDELQPAYEQAARAVRTADPDNMVWFEPQTLSSSLEGATHFTPVAGESQLGFSWHNYCTTSALSVPSLPVDLSGCAGASDRRTVAALDQGAQMDAAALMSEFGATDNTRLLAGDTAAADAHFMSWMHWAYKGWDDPTTTGATQGMFTDDADLGTAKADKLRTLVRTYPQATAGTPLQLSFDPDSGDFTYRYAPRDLGVPTEIYVSPLHYPDGARISVDGGRVSGTEPHHRILVEATGSGPVTVRIHD